MALSDIASGADGGSAGATAETKIFAHISGLLEFYTRRTPAAAALIAPGRPVLTYRALGDRTQDLIRTLRGLGIAPADRIAVALPRGADSALALIAVASAAVCIPVSPDLTADELQRYFSELKLAALVTWADMNSASRDVARALDIAVIDFVPGPEDDLGGCAFIGPRSDQRAPMVPRAGTTMRSSC